jgi:hypothetical protein
MNFNCQFNLRFGRKRAFEVETGTKSMNLFTQCIKIHKLSLIRTKN